MRLIGALLLAGVVALAANFSGGLLIFVDLPSVVFIAGILVGGLLASFRPEDLIRAIRVAAGGDAGRDELRSAMRIVRRARGLTICAGMLGLLIGIVSMLSHLEDPAQLGPATALALLCPLYASVLGYLLFGSVPACLESRSDFAIARRDSRGAALPDQDPRVAEDQLVPVD